MMSRIINLESAGKERTRLTRAIVLAVRELARQNGPGAESRDLAAYIALSLRAIADTIDVSAAAWEKRGYWVKADRFRMDWLWAGQLAEKMCAALLGEDWGAIAALAAQSAQKLNKVSVGENHRLGKPWVGAWQELQHR
jgi:hypothetical protein